jgi:hypothetical protein
MNKAVKNIPVFFMWLAWLVLTVHLIIPHDHHLSGSFSTRENKCPVSDGDTGHKSGFPIHCHAFNDLTSPKATTYFFLEIIRYNNITINSFFDPFALELQFLCITIIDIRKPFPDSHLLEFSPLRAPPSLS